MATFGYWIAMASSSCTPSRFPITTCSRRLTRRPVAPPSMSPNDRARNRAPSSARALVAAKDWPPEAWSPRTKLLYIPANNNVCAYLPKGEVPEANSKGLCGYEVESIFGSVRTGAGASDHLGELQAWDLNTGKRVWQHNFKDYSLGSPSGHGRRHSLRWWTPDRLFRALTRVRRSAVELPAALWSDRRSNVIRGRWGTICRSHYRLGP